MASHHHHHHLYLHHLCGSAAAARPSQVIKLVQLQSLGIGLGLSPSPSRSHRHLKVTQTSFNSRFKNFQNAIRLQVRQNLCTAFASNSSPSGGDSIKDKADGIAMSDTTQGPPFLTILAGFLVFFLVCWVFGSIIIWLFGLIIKGPSPPLK